MAELMSAMLFEKNERALVAHRRWAPFAGQWMLPVTSVRDDEAAEDECEDERNQDRFDRFLDVGLALERISGRHVRIVTRRWRTQ